MRTVLVPGSGASQLVKDRRIVAVTLTRSEAAGVLVATVSGQVLKKNVLELGGSDAFIAFEDADFGIREFVNVQNCLNRSQG